MYLPLPNIRKKNAHLCIYIGRRFYCLTGDEDLYMLKEEVRGSLNIQQLISASFIFLLEFYLLC